MEVSSSSSSSSLTDEGKQNEEDASSIEAAEQLDPRGDVRMDASHKDEFTIADEAATVPGKKIIQLPVLVVIIKRPQRSAR